MSWLARSIANSLRLDDEDDDDENDTAPTTNSKQQIHNEETNSLPQQQQQQDEDEDEDENEEEELELEGVKEDLTELKQTLTRQLWGVASFLAPPPLPLPLPPESSQSKITTDFAEIGGSSTEISKMDFPFGSEENEEQESDVEEEEEEEEISAVGLTDEVLTFARNIAMHPETWLDFPLDSEEDLNDFEMSDVQQEHASAIECLSPQLNALRIELCPCHMSESYFWKVYFVLLHSRLDKHDAEILSTPQVTEARAMWMQELQKQTKKETDWYGRSTSYLKDSTNVLHEDLIPSSNYAPSESMSPRTYTSEPTFSTMTTDYETEKHLVESNETQFVDKSVIEESPVSKTEDKELVGPSTKILIPNFEDDDDDWPEEDSELGGYSGRVICVGTDEDVSFSDLEDDDDGRVPMKSKIVAKGT